MTLNEKPGVGVAVYVPVLAIAGKKSRCDNLVMPVRMGILCERCRTVYFVSRLAKSAHIHYDRARGDFKLTCAPPCKAIGRGFHNELRPFDGFLKQ